MAEKIIIDIYKNKNPDELTKLLADKESRLEAGSAAAMTAASAAALFSRAAAFTAQQVKNDARLDYIVRNAEIIRNYMVYLIDEDVKSRNPLRKALKEGNEREIEAARQPAVCIAGEIINMMGQCLELMLELAESGYENIICAQPFGCLPNHIAGKGMIRRLTQVHPGINIVPIDYDLSATKVNQENRIRLMLAVAGDALKKKQQQDLLIAQDEAAARSCGGACEDCRKNAG